MQTAVPMNDIVSRHRLVGHQAGLQLFSCKLADKLSLPAYNRIESRVCMEGPSLIGQPNRMAAGCVGNSQHKPGSSPPEFGGIGGVTVLHGEHGIEKSTFLPERAAGGGGSKRTLRIFQPAEPRMLLHRQRGAKTRIWSKILLLTLVFPKPVLRRGHLAFSTNSSTGCSGLLQRGRATAQPSGSFRGQEDRSRWGCPYHH